MPSSDARKIILQIDGSIGHRAELERAIGQVRPGTVVHSFDDARAAIELLHRCGQGVPMPDRLLLSRVLPGMDGYDVLREVRALAHLASLPVILVHGDNQAEDVRRALELGAAAYLRKPVEKGEYVKFARAILEWRPREEIAHELRTMLATAISPSDERALSSSAMHPAAVLRPSPAPQTDFLSALWSGLTAYVPALRELSPAALAGVHVDQDAIDIRYACNQARITVAEVMNVRLSEHQMQLKRRKFYAILLERAWGMSQVQAMFPMAQTDYLKKIRAALPKSRTDRALPPS